MGLPLGTKVDTPLVADVRGGGKAFTLQSPEVVSIVALQQSDVQFVQEFHTQGVERSYGSFHINSRLAHDAQTMMVPCVVYGGIPEVVPLRRIALIGL